MRIPAKVPRSVTFLVAMTLLLGFAYPALVTAVAQLAFPRQANGSLIVRAVSRGESRDGARVAGSELLAQKFEGPRFFRARPSATDYTYLGAGASNLGPTSADLAASVAEREAAWKASFGSEAPREMLYASGSGLDPDVSLQAALAQAPGVAAARALDEPAKAALVAAIRAEARASASLIAGPRVNIVRLNVLLESDPLFAGGGK